MSLTDVLAAAFGLLALGAGIGVVTTRRIVRAGLWLAVSFAGIAGVALVLTAEFLAWVLVLVYVGAIVVLLLFATMLTRAPTEASDELDRRQLPGILIASGVGLGLAAVLTGAFGWTRVSLVGRENGDAAAMGEAIFSEWVLPFEVLSLLLLAALVGAIAVSTRDRAQQSGNSG
ncbi:NADH-quinone oxidoreductase subunit J family protein [Glycomyces buryatensis]|uniref:NADH-quinone oxidoreductase subunit J n=1 Tax=Glycomyces buryatensis TaxID=2570927 RepID=A0A4S8QF81_9ACTN|nr:NADH-quinone oxidoreductase subunit J [Glycomyces buryatensis]THV42331.1 NADH-quinone oxidoreductase subunit J [Glycomyces buryatensis]